MVLHRARAAFDELVAEERQCQGDAGGKNGGNVRGKTSDVESSEQSSHKKNSFQDATEGGPEPPMVLH